VVWANDTSGNTGSTYVAPYELSINGAKLTGFICDDYAGNISTNLSWTATETLAKNITTSNVDSLAFGSTIGVVGYAEVATIAEDLFTYGGKIGGVSYSDTALNSAIWYITADNPSIVAFSALGSAAQTLVTELTEEYGGSISGGLETFGTSAADIQAALTSLEHDGGIYFLTATSGSNIQEGIGDTYAPEGGPAALYLLLGMGCCFGGLVVSRRKPAESRG
jgi:hypothetical protein